MNWFPAATTNVTPSSLPASSKPNGRNSNADTLAEREETVAREREIARAYQAAKSCCAKRSVIILAR